MQAEPLRLFKPPGFSGSQETPGICGRICKFRLASTGSSSGPAALGRCDGGVASRLH